MLDKIDYKLLGLLQNNCDLSLQALSEAVNLTSTPCWKRIKRLEDEGYIRAKVALLDAEKLGVSLTAFMLIKTSHHSENWYKELAQTVGLMAEVLSFYRLAGEYDYLMQICVADMKSYDAFYKKLVKAIPDLTEVTSSFAMEKIKHTTELPLLLPALLK